MSPVRSRTLIICMPAGVPADWFSASTILDWHQQPPGTPHPMFPVRRLPVVGWFNRWSTRHLVRAVRHRGAVRWAAGGRKARLDLTAAALLAHERAAWRWRAWTQIVRATPVAKPWTEFLAHHQAAPAKLTLDEARRRFEAQPRVLAMLAYNTRPLAPTALDPYELDAYQAGEATYTALHWQQAIAADALITGDGRLLEPASPSLADKLRYLSEAVAHLHQLRRGNHLLAVTVGTHP